ncbi:MAG: hypothetical protein KQH63_10435 [Desulfobulbaceae bacterium]|nr:hypothetical protein [Desulfobulbaceae bacterium]
MNDKTDQNNHQEPGREFVIKDCALIAIATGSRAMTLRELRDLLLSVTPDSIYYHFWGGLLQPRFEEREYNNDFAAWAWYEMHDAILAERLAVIDPTECQNMEELRQQLLEIVEERLDERETVSWMFASAPFEFIRSQIVVFDTGKRAASPEELAALLPDVSPSSIFYHFIDSRRRLGHHGDDFSFWLSGFNACHRGLCDKLVAIDPYFVSLPELKNQLVKLFQTHFNKETV